MIKNIDIASLILITVLTIIATIITFILQLFINFIPFLIFFIAPISSLIIGPIIILLCHKIPKSGVFFFSSLVRALLSVIFQEPYTYLAITIGFGLISEITFFILNRQTAKARLVSYTIYTLGFSIVLFLPILLLKDFYTDLLVRRGWELTEVTNLIDSWNLHMFWLVLATTLICAPIGAIYGEYKLRYFNVDKDLLDRFN